uniref:RRM domain-containing protein n=1 Tax=Pyrodinium bahamense TaxID=73915 RepID=A0A7S0B990_9DINO|mmetsp:Transcript_6154/g.16739  ORF Transcript_6154/g.16739 Transcript_6154/m.16739 type:complete len:536 (+) Transcript_6154:136-1743(+)
MATAPGRKHWAAPGASLGVAPASLQSGSSLTVRYSSRDGTPSSEIYIIGWPADQDKAQLTQKFTSWGYNVTKSHLLPDTKGCGTCAGFVQLGSREEAASAISQLNGAPLDVCHTTQPVQKKLLPRAIGGRTGGSSGLSGGSSSLIGSSSSRTGGSSSLTGGSSSRSGSSVVARPPASNFNILKYYDFKAKQVTLTVKYSSRDQSPTNELYIIGWPASSNPTQLSQTFEAEGFNVVKSSLLPDTKGLGTCAGFVKLASEEEAAAAIEAFHGAAVEMPNPPPVAAALSAAAAVAAPLAAALRSLTAVAAGRNNAGTRALAPPAKATGINMAGKMTVRYSSRDQTPTNEVYLIGWPTSLDIAKLNRLFESLGLTVQKSNLLPDTKGCGTCAGFVKLASQEEAALAIEGLNDQTLGTILKAAAIGGSNNPATPIKVNLTVRYSARDGTPSSEVYIMGWPTSLGVIELNRTLADMGYTVVKSSLLRDSKGFGLCGGFVTFASEEEAALAISALHQQPLSVTPSGGFAAEEAPWKRARLSG